MTPKERRDRLFKSSRPHIRPLGNQDMGWLWAAYKAGSFQLPPDMTQEDFGRQMSIAMNGISHYLVEDQNGKFQSKRGPVALIGVASDGEMYEPAVKMFRWASPRNALRSYVAFYQWVRSSKEGSKYQTRVPAADKLFKRLVDYGVIVSRRVEIVYVPKARK